MERKCLTPGSIYSFNFKGNVISIDITLPNINITESEAIEIEKRIHDELEIILAFKFTQDN